MFIDSHAHISKNELMPVVEGMLARAKEANIKAIVNICTDRDSLFNGLEIQKQFPWVYLAAATPPHDVVQEGETLFPLMAEYARNGSLVAVGETGLDYFYYKETKDQQIHFLRLYLKLALECQLPVVIHCRDAFADFFEIVDSDYRDAPGVLHCFTGTQEEANGVIERGWYLSLSGIVTYKKSEQLRAIAKQIPIDQLLIETDAPFLAPQSHRGKTNEPAYLVETARIIADARGITLEELARATTNNALRLFKIL